ncbi:MAG: 50S ribosome-binding GTPase [Sedimentisphaerales bacterium]|nr:50S ribosome-binding GTPase [Sedimentisphaerales bacterium]
MLQNDTLRFVIVGHVDHGKSTLIGRLLYDTDSLPPDKIEEIKKASAGQGKQTEFAYLLDHLEEERKQGITIDTTQVFFKSPKRRYVIIDAPGHIEFVKNMITGASQAEAAVLIVDAAEGVKEQTRRHSYMLSLLGFHKVVVVLNKMDLAGFSEERFKAVKKDIEAWLGSINVGAEIFIPISAIKGDNVASKSENMKWYEGPTFLESLDTLVNRQAAEEKSLLFPVQDVYKIADKRINVGRVEAGVIRKGLEIKILPSGQTTKVNSIEKFLEETNRAGAGECIGITTTDSVFLERGNIVCLPGKEPIFTDRISASIFWMTRQGFEKGQKLTMRCATQETTCKVESINKRIDSSTLDVIAENADTIKNLEVAEVIIKTKKELAIKNFNDVQELGRFVLVQNENICAGGIITHVS